MSEAAAAAGSPIGERPGALAWTRGGRLSGVPRTAHTAVPYARHRSAFVYGGQSGSEILGDVVLVGVVDRLPLVQGSHPVEVRGTPPRPRWLHTAVLDTVAATMIVYGGALGRTSPCSDEVWLLVDPAGRRARSEWRRLEPGGPAPAPRANHSAVYDQSNGRLIVFGGHDCIAPMFSDVWVLAGANGRGRARWSRLAPETPREAAIGRVRHVAAYHPRSNRMIVYGGMTPDGIAGDVWILEHANGLGGRPRWVRLHPAGPDPPPREGAGAAYDAESDRLFVFSGWGMSGSGLDDAGVLEGASGSRGRPVWRRLDLDSPRPRPRLSAAALTIRSGASSSWAGTMTSPIGHI